MAGPSVVVRVLGDLTGLGKSLGAVEAKGASTSSKLRAGFKGMFSALNTTGVLGPVSEMFDTIDNGFDQMAEHKKKFGDLAMVGGGVVAGIGATLATIGSKEAQAKAQLKSTIEATGQSWDAYEGQVDKAIKTQEHFGNSSVETQDALRILTNTTGSTKTALADLGLASDLAASKHESLSAAALQLGKVYNGSSRILKEYGIATIPTVAAATKTLTAATNQAQGADAKLTTAKLRLKTMQDQYKTSAKLSAVQQDRLRAAEDAVTAASAKDQAAHQKLKAAQDGMKLSAHGATDTMQALSDKLKGQAADAANTFSGRMHALTTVVEDQVAQFGAKYGPALTAAGSALGGLGGAVKTGQALMGTFSKATEDTSKVVEVSSAAEDASMAPMLLTIGAVVLAVAAIGIAAYELYKHWKTVWGWIKDAVSAVWNWIKTNWPLLLAIILGPIALAALEIAKHWKAIKAGAVNAFNDVVNTVKGLPAKITAAAVGMFDGIWQAFRATINHVIDLWNKLHLKLPAIHLPFGLGHFGGETFKVPQIPHLAQGGLITQTGLVYAHAGEAITPAPHGNAPALHIEHASFTEPVDLDLLMKKLEFALTAGLPV